MIENVIDNTNKKLLDRIINNVDEILKMKSENSSRDVSIIEKEIDKIVYELYNLNDEEIRLIEGVWNAIKKNSN